MEDPESASLAKSLPSPSFSVIYLSKTCLREVCSSLVLSLKLLLLLSTPAPANGIMQTGAVDVSLRDGSSYTLLSSQASFGKYPAEGPSKNQAARLELSPSSNELLCNNITSQDQQPAKFNGHP